MKDFSPLLKRKNICILFAVVLLASFVACFLPRTIGKRYVCTFPMIGTEMLVTEVRYVQARDGLTDVQAFVDDLLLGSQEPRTRPLFSRGTKALFCFLRNKTLYVNLSEDALWERNDAAKILDGIELFKMNILRNCKSVKQIELFIDGRAVEKPSEEEEKTDTELLNEH